MKRIACLVLAVGLTACGASGSSSPGGPSSGQDDSGASTEAGEVDATFDSVAEAEPSSETEAAAWTDASGSQHGAGMRGGLEVG